uniref:Uncharacterized protein n=1 Tax=Oryza barthii TaxID=65489 RepID=A0A0D3HTR3_9ORYZ
MGFPCSVGPGKNHLLERSGKIPREERRRNEHTDATAGVACGATWRRRQRRRHGSLLRPPPSLRLHVHQLELEKTNLLLPGTLYPLQEEMYRTHIFLTSTEEMLQES